MSSSDKSDPGYSYTVAGYEIVNDLFTIDDFAPVTEDFLGAAEDLTGRRFSSLHDPELCQILSADLKLESRLYDQTKHFSSVRALAFHRRLTDAVASLMPGPFGVFEKAVMRIDLPHHTTEVAHWHQDFFYVRGNAATVTAWIPLQDVNQLNGCLEIAPGSHAWGAIDHPRKLGKRDCPSEDIMARVDPLDVPMDRGGALLFHALLLHSGRLNRSDATRYSIQYRYTPLDLPTDPGMGAVLPVTTA